MFKHLILIDLRITDYTGMMSFNRRTLWDHYTNIKNEYGNGNFKSLYSKHHATRTRKLT